MTPDAPHFPPLTAAAEKEGPGLTVTVAGFWRRSMATAVDGLILSPILVILGWIAFRVTGLRVPLQTNLRLESLLELVLEGGAMLYGLVAMGLFILLLYGFFFMSTTGATPGSRLLRVRVINLFGETPEWWRMLLRCLGFVVCVLLLGLGFFWIAIDREKRGLHDWMAGTYVIHSRRGAAMDCPGELQRSGS
jgi:uncharacterized RDD family membrane protein YckC